MVKRVVITGLGPVTSVGIGKRCFFERLCAGGSLAVEIPDAFKARHRFRSRHYIPFPAFALKDHGVTERFKSILQSEDRAAILGTKLALEDAGFELEARKDGTFAGAGFEAACVIIGVGMSSLDNVFSSHLAHLGLSHPDEAAKRGRYNRMIVPMAMSNSPAAWASILFKCKGGSHTVNASCASGTVAVGEAYRRIAEGRCRLVVTGGVESLADPDGAIMRGFDMLGALTTSPDGGCEPFSNDRSGFLFAEGGGAILVLEELEHALLRGAPIYAEVVDYAESCDAHNIVQPDETGEQIVRVLERLARGREIDHLNSHGTGTVANDRTEHQAIRAVFGEEGEQPVIAATKGITGHTIGASGAIETVATALSIRESRIHGTAVADPLEGLNLARETVDREVRAAITVSYGFGGHNAGLLMERYEP